MGFIGSDILGIAGAFLVVVAWAFEVRQLARTKHSALDWNYGVIYLAGALLLTAYSLQINALVFTVLNLLAALLALTGLYFKWKQKESVKNEGSFGSVARRKRTVRKGKVRR